MIMTGVNIKTGKRETLDVPACFVKSRIALGYREVSPTTADGKDVNPEFLAAFPATVKQQRGPGAKFGATPAGQDVLSPIAPAAEPAETAAQRHARKNGAAPAAEPGKE